MRPSPCSCNVHNKKAGRHWPARKGSCRRRSGRHSSPELVEVGGPLIVVEDFGATNQLAGLVLDGGNHGGVGVAQIGGSLATHTVDILRAIGIPQRCAQPAHDGNAALPVGAAGAHIFVADDFGVGLEG